MNKEQEPQIIGYRSECKSCSWISKLENHYQDAVIEAWRHQKESEFAGEQHIVVTNTIRE